jgi:hypothetical protein
VIERLGVDGMSSDESDVDTDARGREVTVFYTKRMRWRRWIEEELAIIDGCHSYAKAHGRGSKLVERRRNGRNAESSRNPMPNLPEAFYDEEWLNSRSSKYRDLTLHVSKDNFEWFKISQGN